MHGHQLRRRAELIDIAEWADVRPGAIYGALHRMQDEGLLAPLRREQEGRFPARTIYALTEEGHLELASLRQRVLQHRGAGADPVNLALSTAGGMPAAELRALLADRKREVQRALETVRSERERLARVGYLTAWAKAVMRHNELRLEGEVRWHEELEALIPDIAAGQPFPVGAKGETPPRVMATNTATLMPIIT